MTTQEKLRNPTQKTLDAPKEVVTTQTNTQSNSLSKLILLGLGAGLLSLLNTPEDLDPEIKAEFETIQAKFEDLKRKIVRVRYATDISLAEQHAALVSQENLLGELIVRLDDLLDKKESPKFIELFENIEEVLNDVTVEKLARHSQHTKDIDREAWINSYPDASFSVTNDLGVLHNTEGVALYNGKEFYYYLNGWDYSFQDWYNDQDIEIGHTPTTYINPEITKSVNVNRPSEKDVIHLSLIVRDEWDDTMKDQVDITITPQTNKLLLDVSANKFRYGEFVIDSNENLYAIVSHLSLGSMKHEDKVSLCEAILKAIPYPYLPPTFVRGRNAWPSENSHTESSDTGQELTIESVVKRLQDLRDALKLTPNDEARNYLFFQSFGKEIEELGQKLSSYLYLKAPVSKTDTVSLDPAFMNSFLKGNKFLADMLSRIGPKSIKILSEVKFEDKSRVLKFRDKSKIKLNENNKIHSTCGPALVTNSGEYYSLDGKFCSYLDWYHRVYHDNETLQSHCRDVFRSYDLSLEGKNYKITIEDAMLLNSKVIRIERPSGAVFYFTIYRYSDLDDITHYLKNRDIEFRSVSSYKLRDMLLSMLEPAFVRKMEGMRPAHYI